MKLFVYLFWPNPSGWHYTDSRVQIVLGVCFFLIVFSFAISYWRRTLKNPITKNLTKSWSSAAFWFGIVGAVLIASRVEMIQFMAMRAVLVLWFLCILLYIGFQFIQFRRRHYTVMQRTQVIDERDKYLPRGR